MTLWRWYSLLHHSLPRRTRDNLLSTSSLVFSIKRKRLQRRKSSRKSLPLLLRPRPRSQLLLPLLSRKLSQLLLSLPKSPPSQLRKSPSRLRRQRPRLPRMRSSQLKKVSRLMKLPRRRMPLLPLPLTRKSCLDVCLLVLEVFSMPSCQQPSQKRKVSNQDQKSSLDDDKLIFCFCIHHQLPLKSRLLKWPMKRSRRLPPRLLKKQPQWLWLPKCPFFFLLPPLTVRLLQRPVDGHSWYPMSTGASRPLPLLLLWPRLSFFVSSNYLEFPILFPSFDSIFCDSHLNSIFHFSPPSLPSPSPFVSSRLFLCCMYIARESICGDDDD